MWSIIKEHIDYNKGIIYFKIYKIAIIYTLNNEYN